MEVLNVFVAAFAGFVVGAVWYMVLAEPWMQASGVPRDENGKPEGMQNPKVFAATFLLQVIVAGMMRHVFEGSGVDTIFTGVLSGLGIGLFFISPWIAINNLYGGRPFKLTLIDGSYATLACAVIGLVLLVLVLF